MSDAEGMSVSEFYSDESQLIERIESYLKTHACSPEAAQFEKEIEQAAFKRLEQQGMLTWDFDTRYPFFGDRGTSILIQNLELDWHSTWQWLEQRCQGMPEGAIINFEVYDNIRDGVMRYGHNIARHVITAKSIWSQSL